MGTKYGNIYFMIQMKKELVIFAPAKVNLHLAVGDKRPDGFHNLESVFTAVDFGDTLYFILKEEGESGLDIDEITMFGMEANEQNPPIPPEKNIVLKALTLFRAKTHFSKALGIKIEKRIPIGGGLGGGSSDAAAALLAFNKLAGFPLGFEALLELAAALGSDVPFFIHQTTAAKVTGRGECIQPVDLSFKHFVLVNPGFVSDTAAAFRLLDEQRDQRYSCRDAKMPEQKNKTGSFAPHLLFEFSHLCGANFYNDFLDVFVDPEKSVYNSIITGLYESGAEFAGLSGAGSTCFGVFSGEESGLRAAAALRDVYGFAEYCRTFLF